MFRRRAARGPDEHARRAGGRRPPQHPDEAAITGVERDAQGLFAVLADLEAVDRLVGHAGVEQLLDLDAAHLAGAAAIGDALFERMRAGAAQALVLVEQRALVRVARR